MSVIEEIVSEKEENIIFEWADANAKLLRITQPHLAPKMFELHYYPENEIFFPNEQKFNVKPAMLWTPIFKDAKGKYLAINDCINVGWQVVVKYTDNENPRIIIEFTGLTKIQQTWIDLTNIDLPLIGYWADNPKKHILKNLKKMYNILDKQMECINYLLTNKIVQIQKFQVLEKI